MIRLHFTRTLLLCIGALVAGGCHSPVSFQQCEEPSAAELEALPENLSDAGLYANIATGELEPRVWPFAPRFPLWTDGAKKRRWISLPDGTSVDTRDMDNWQFPVGTKLFKEFARDGVAVETRLFKKTGPAAHEWSASAYVWDFDGAEARLAPNGGVDQRGTPHDVPDASKCIGCHGGRSSRILGFSAVQLAWTPPEGFATVADFKAAGLLSDDVPERVEVPGTALDQAALGYLHGNCSHCHNLSRPEHTGLRCFNPETDFDFGLSSTSLLLGVDDAPAYKTAVQAEVLQPGNAAESEMILRLSGGFPSMPPLGIEIPDPTGHQVLNDWVDSL